MPDPQPIRPDVVPHLDIEREMLAFVADKLSAYIAENGAPPSIAFVFVGADRAESETEAHSWSPADEGRCKFHVCSVASTMMLKRALGSV